MKNLFMLFVVVVITGFNARSQVATDTLQQTTTDSIRTQAAPVTTAKNLVKLNLTGLFFGNYIGQYERVIGRKSSLALTVGIAPNAGLPFKESLKDNFSDDEEAQKAIESTLYTKYNFTLEYRYYFSKAGAPKGFYVAPFIRYMHMELEQDYPFTPSDNQPHVATVSSKFGAFGGGLLLGAQWTIKKHWGIDFWIIGGFYGTEINADFHGVDPIGGLSPQDITDLEEDIEAIELAGYTVDATVTQHPSGKPAIVDATVKGPYYGIRGAGLCLVYRF